MSSLQIYITNIINPISDKNAKLLLNSAIVVEDEKIKEIGDSFKLLKKYESLAPLIIDRSKFICLPTFFDMHFHWVQDDVRLMPKDSLLEWLSKYTWPYEEKFKSYDYTKKKVDLFSKELVKAGTLGGACYASIHSHTVDMALEYFVGDFTVGNVLMDMNSPDYLSQSNEEAIATVQALSPKYKSNYAVTPRFAPTTSPAVMKETSKIGKKNKSFIQTHLAETPNEIDYVLSIYKNLKGFEKVKTYTEIYQKTNVLGPKTIMGHGIYLNNEELKILAKTKTSICHCPTSNAPVKELGLGSGLFDFKNVEKKKIQWALGSDIGGGPYLSMFDVMRSFVEQNKKKKIKEATFIKALYRSTIAGAKILKLDKTHGSIDKNKFANFLFIEAKLTKEKDVEKILSKIIMAHKNNRQQYDQMVSETVYKGQRIYSLISK